MKDSKENGLGPASIGDNHDPTFQPHHTAAKREGRPPEKERRWISDVAERFVRAGRERNVHTIERGLIEENMEL